MKYSQTQDGAPPIRQLQFYSRARQSIATIATLILLPVQLVANQPDARSHDVGAAKFVFAGIRHHVTTINSGTCTFKGHLHLHTEGKPDLALEGDTEGFLAIEDDKVRYDITGPDRVADRSSVKADSTSGKAITATRAGIASKRFADTRRIASTWHSENAIAFVCQSQDAPKQHHFGYVDVRVITLFDPVATNQGYSLERLLTQLEKDAREANATLVDVDPSTKQLTWLVNANDYYVSRFSLIIDVINGFTPTQFKCEIAPITEQQKPESWHLVWRNATSWKRVNAVFVPVSHTSSFYKSPLSSTEKHQSFEYAWDLVNEDVSDDLFTVSTFDLPDHVAIQDISTGQPVWIKEPAVRTQNEMSTPNVWLVSSLCIAMLGAIAAFYALRRRSPG